MAEPQGLQHFLLKWNNHRSNMVNVFESLLQSENLVDVTLAVEGKFLKGHKIVLSACSPYFESMFVNQTPGEKHPILIFHDMKFSHLKTLLDFMYRGEISIDEKDLSDVLKVAEALSIRGLSSFESDDENDSEKSCEQNGNGNDNQSSNNNNNTSNNNNSNTSNGGGGSSAGGGLNSTSGASGSGYNGYNANNNSASINSNENSNSNQTQNQNDNHCLGGSGNTNCDSSVNGSLANKTQTKTSASVRGQKKGTAAFNNSSTSSPPTPSPVKRRRGRGVKKDPPTTNPRNYKPEFQSSGPEPVKSTISNRQRVRRRVPRQFSAPNPVTTPNTKSLNRIKIERGSDTEEIGGTRSGTTTPDDDDMDTSDFMDGASGILPADMCGSEPLSEMSVRGLDLFKYASIENNVYRCIECEKLGIPKTFKNKYSFQRHAFLYHEGNMRKVFPCPVCSREFSRPDKMKNHLRSIHEGKTINRQNNNGTSPLSEPPGGTDSNDKCDG